MLSLVRFLLVMAMAGILPGCVKLTLAWSDLSPKGAPAAPVALASFNDTDPVDALAKWEASREGLKQTFQNEVYGFLPDASSTDVLEVRVLDEAAFNGAGRLEEYTLRASATFSGATRQTSPFVMNVVLPVDAAGPVPIILVQTFCPRWNTIPHPAITKPEGARDCDEGSLSGVIKYVFGRYISTPPLEVILKRGYGFATIYPSSIVPDRAEEGFAALDDLAEGHQNSETRWGAIAAWGWSYSRMADVLLADDRIDANGLITYGHSRYGKAALFAAAFDERIGGTISHQSGTGGASLNRDKKGESVDAITENYPHWFARTYADFAEREEEMTVDQHQLLALVAPRPVMLGNARRDVWSDPNGAFKAAIGADPVYELYGNQGLTRERLNQFDPSADISFWIRPGTHGVVKEDWPAFLQFLDAHFSKLGS